MYSMFDLFQQAQGGAAFDNLARSYNMTPDQMRAATAALAPAFMQGLQRQWTDDSSARRFAGLFQTETYARAFEQQAAALDQGTRGAGEDALGALFGSKEVSRAVAAQAAAVSGVQAQIIRQVLPILASILMGGFMKAMQGAQIGRPAGGGASAFPGPFGEIFGQMFGQGQQSAPQSRQGSAPANPFEQWMDMFGGGAGRQSGPAAQPSNPMGDMMGDILNSMFAGAPRPQPETPREPEPKAPEPKAPEPEAAEPAGSGDAPRQTDAASPLDDMVRTGRELSAQNAEAMERIFDAFFGGKTSKS